MTRNIKHKCIISLLYSAGLRRSKLLNLKIKEIDSERMTIRRENGKVAQLEKLYRRLQEEKENNVTINDIIEDLKHYKNHASNSEVIALK